MTMLLFYIDISKHLVHSHIHLPVHAQVCAHVHSHIHIHMYHWQGERLKCVVIVWVHGMRLHAV